MMVNMLMWWSITCCSCNNLVAYELTIYKCFLIQIEIFNLGFRKSLVRCKLIKSIIIWNTWLRGKNDFLGIDYMAVGHSCLIIWIVLLFLSKKYSKRWHQIQFYYEKFCFVFLTYFCCILVHFVISLSVILLFNSCCFFCQRNENWHQINLRFDKFFSCFSFCSFCCFSCYSIFYQDNC